MYHHRIACRKVSRVAILYLSSRWLAKTLAMGSRFVAWAWIASRFNSVDPLWIRDLACALRVSMGSVRAASGILADRMDRKRLIVICD